MNHLPRLFCIALLVLPALTQATEYTSVLVDSHLTFHGDYQGTGFDGSFHRWLATLRYDPAHPEQTQIEVTVSLASATTGDAQRDAMLPTPAFFDSARFATAHFISQSAQRTATGDLIASGKLELKGVTLPAKLNLHFQRHDSKLLLDVQAQLKRLDFHIGSGEYADTSVIGNTVAIQAHLRLQAHPSAKPHHIR